MSIDLQQMALNLIRSNPQVANNPRTQELVDVIANNDSVRGMQIATNMCNSYGKTPEQASNMARKFFGL